MKRETGRKHTERGGDVYQGKGPLTQASITRTKTITLTMHAFYWLNERGRIVLGAIQPIKYVLFAP